MAQCAAVFIMNTLMYLENTPSPAILAHMRTTEQKNIQLGNIVNNILSMMPST